MSTQHKILAKGDLTLELDERSGTFDLDAYVGDGINCTRYVTAANGLTFADLRRIRDNINKLLRSTQAGGLPHRRQPRRRRLQ